MNIMICEECNQIQNVDKNWCVTEQMLTMPEIVKRVNIIKMKCEQCLATEKTNY